jgi:hypothetical protein
MPGFTAGFVRPSDYLPGWWPGALSRSFGVLRWDAGRRSEARPHMARTGLSAHGGSMFCRGSTVRIGLTRWGRHEDRAWRVLEHLERHAAAQPGRKLAAA